MFEVLWSDKSVSESGGEYRPGGVAVANVGLKCPFCGMEFFGVRRSGCFMDDIYPSACPNCSFPNNVLGVIRTRISMEENEEWMGHS